MSDTATILRRNFARYLAPHYLRDCAEIARICDEELDQSGELLGYVREEAGKLTGAADITEGNKCRRTGTN